MSRGYVASFVGAWRCRLVTQPSGPYKANARLRSISSNGVPSACQRSQAQPVVEARIECVPVAPEPRRRVPGGVADEHEISDDKLHRHLVEHVAQRPAGGTDRVGIRRQQPPEPLRPGEQQRDTHGEDGGHDERTDEGYGSHCGSVAIDRLRRTDRRRSARRLVPLVLVLAGLVHGRGWRKSSTVTDPVPEFRSNAGHQAGQGLRPRLHPPAMRRSLVRRALP